LFKLTPSAFWVRAASKAGWSRSCRTKLVRGFGFRSIAIWSKC